MLHAPPLSATVPNPRRFIVRKLTPNQKRDAVMVGIVFGLVLSIPAILSLLGVR